MKSSFLIVMAFLCGCSLLGGGGKIRMGKDSVTAPRDAQAAATLDEGRTTQVLMLPKGSTVVINETPLTASAPTKGTTYTMGGDSTQTTTGSSSRAEVPPSRAPDQTVALTRLTNSERRPFLIAAVALTFGAGALLYFHLMSFARLAGLAAGVCIVFWWALGNEKLLTYCFLVLAAVTGGYFIYSDFKKKRLQGALVKTVQSVEEFAVDHPADAEILKKDYLKANLIEHTDVITKAEKGIDTSYIKERTQEKLDGVG